MRLKELLTNLNNIKETGEGYTAQCPSHDDQHNSLSVSQGKGDRILLLHCHAGCSPEHILEAMGLKMSDLYPPKEQRQVVAEYDYLDLDGKLVHKTVRFEPKGFSQCRPDGIGGWIYNLKGIQPVIYNLPKVAEAIKENKTVLLVEGEKDCENLGKLGIVATTSPMGAGKWRPGYAEFLKNASVVIVPDNDEAGRGHAEQVAKSLSGKAKSVKLINLPDLKEKQDITDFFQAKGNKEGLKILVQLIQTAPEFKIDNDDFGCFTSLELANTILPDIRWIIPEFLPEGIALINGKPKIGKSWLMMGLAVAVSTGGMFLGKIQTEPGRVLYLALEDNKRRLKSRQEKVLFGKMPSSKLHFATEWPKVDQGGIQKLEGFLKQYPDTRLVVIDTLQKIKAKPKHGSSSLYAEDYGSVEELKGISDRHNIAILIVHHVRKAGSEDVFETISGTTGLSGGVDGLMVLQRDRTRADAVLSITGRDITDKELALKWIGSSCRWELLGNAVEYRMSQERQEVLDVLRAHPEPMKGKDIAEALGKTYASIRYLLSRMFGDKQIDKGATGSYYISNPHTPHSTHTTTTPYTPHTTTTNNNNKKKNKDKVLGVDMDTPHSDMASDTNCLEAFVSGVSGVSDDALDLFKEAEKLFAGSEII